MDSIAPISDNTFYPHIQLPKKRHVLYPLVEAINMMLDQLKKSLTSVRRFNAKVSHELKTPLTIIRGEMEVALMKDREPQEYKDLLYSSLEEIDTLQLIIDNMLLLTKLDTKSIKIKKLNIRLDKTIKESIDSCSIHASVKNITINAELEPIIYPAEEILLGQSIKNLVTNAIKYSPEKTTINVSLKKSDGAIKLQIIDEGYGISKDDLQNIFQPFFRANKDNKETTGEGLGLAIVYHTIHIHNGKISVDSTVGKGTRFTIIFKD